jgi:protein TonB
MQQMIRFTCSGFLGFFITAALFIGMLNLLDLNYKVINTENMDFKISYVNAEIDIKERKRQIKKPPEIQKSSQPPAAPQLKIVQNDSPMFNSPNTYNNGKNLNILNKISMPGLKMDVEGANIASQGGVKAGIPPIYPPAAILKNAEGWVQVMISVNEMGSVSDVAVLKSNPPRLFDNAAIKAVKKWSFYQKKVDDKAVPYQFSQTIEFKIDPIIEEN